MNNPQTLSTMLMYVSQSGIYDLIDNPMFEPALIDCIVSFWSRQVGDAHAIGDLITRTNAETGRNRRLVDIRVDEDVVSYIIDLDKPVPPYETDAENDFDVAIANSVGGELIDDPSYYGNLRPGDPSIVEYAFYY
jgi:hypothetical protein